MTGLAGADVAWLGELAESGGWDYFDVLMLHPYSFRALEAASTTRSPSRQHRQTLSQRRGEYVRDTQSLSTFGFPIPCGRAAANTEQALGQVTTVSGDVIHYGLRASEAAVDELG